MNFKQSVFVAVSCLVLAVTVSANGLLQHDSDMGLLSFMSRSNDLLQRNPTRSLDCFNYYIPIINQLAVQYETDYNSLLNAAASQRTIAEDATLEQRNKLASKAQISCARLSVCGESESVENVFNCYKNGGTENGQTMFDINADASEGLQELLEKFRLIENEEYKRTNQTKRAYEISSAAAYNNLNSCIIGNSAVPTEAPSTAAPSTVAPTTNAPFPTAGPTSSSLEVEESVEEVKLPQEDLARKILKYRV